MDLDTTSALAIAIIFISVALTSFFFLKKKDLHLTMIDKQQLPEGFAIITFRHPKSIKMRLDPGQSFSLRYAHSLSIVSDQGKGRPIPSTIH